MRTSARASDRWEAHQSTPSRAGDSSCVTACWPHSGSMPGAAHHGGPRVARRPARCRALPGRLRRGPPRGGVQHKAAGVRAGTRRRHARAVDGSGREHAGHRQHAGRPRRGCRETSTPLSSDRTRLRPPASGWSISRAAVRSLLPTKEGRYGPPVWSPGSTCRARLQWITQLRSGMSTDPEHLPRAEAECALIEIAPNTPYVRGTDLASCVD